MLDRRLAPCRSVPLRGSGNFAEDGLRAGAAGFGDFEDDVLTALHALEELAAEDAVEEQQQECAAGRAGKTREADGRDVAFGVEERQRAAADDRAGDARQERGDGAAR